MKFPRGPTLGRDQVKVALAMAALFTVGFYATDQYMAAWLLRGLDFWEPALSWDARIPFEPRWIWIYFLYFPACFLPLTIRKICEDRHLFRRTALGFALQFLVAMIIFWVLPSRMEQPALETEGLSAEAARWFYGIDPGFNVFPSLHVANITYVACLVGRLGNRAVGAAVWVLALLIAASTLFVKQHYLADLPAGALLGAASCLLAFSRIPSADASSRAGGRKLQAVLAASGLALLAWLVPRIDWASVRSSWTARRS